MMLISRIFAVAVVIVGLSQVAMCGNTSTGTVRIGVNVVPTVQVMNPTHPDQVGSISMGDQPILQIAPQRQLDHSQEMQTIGFESSDQEQSHDPSNATNAVLIRHTYIAN
jgi:hypothetical protein